MHSAIDVTKVMRALLTASAVMLVLISVCGATSLTKYYTANVNQVLVKRFPDKAINSSTLVRIEGRPTELHFYGSIAQPCRTEATVISASVLSARRVSEINSWRQGIEGCGPEFFIGPSPVVWTLNDEITFGDPVRRKTFDGGEYDASPMTIVRDKAPWITYFWGYKLGLTESRGLVDAVTPGMSDWPRSELPTGTDDFTLVSLPAPIVEGIVTEYRNTNDFANTPVGVFFYAASDDERRWLDTQQNWSRTGKSFKHGGYLQVCRFYGSVSPGPNSHFYTASAHECELLKSLQIKPTPNDRQQLNYEGIAFFANMPIAPKALGQALTCPVGSMPLYRAYNAAFGLSGKRNYDSNHRYSTSRVDIAEVVANGWIDEGVQMCVPE